MVLTIPVKCFDLGVKEKGIKDGTEILLKGCVCVCVCVHVSVFLFQILWLKQGGSSFLVGTGN